MTLQDHLDDIMDCFDFQIVHKTMTALNWKWAIYDEVRIPDVSDLRKEVRKLVKHAWKLSHERKEPICSGTGGFEVVVSQHKDGDSVTVKFVLEDYESNPNPDDSFSIN